MTREPQKYEALLAGHYSESNHFVYELLQNAEDEKADRVVIEYYDDKLVFYHNGIPLMKMMSEVYPLCLWEQKTEIQHRQLVDLVWDLSLCLSILISQKYIQMRKHFELRIIFAGGNTEWLGLSKGNEGTGIWIE